MLSISAHSKRKIIRLGAVVLLALSAASCKRSDETSHRSTGMSPVEPVIEVAPLRPSRGQWKVATSEVITLTVSAPGTKQVLFWYRPVGDEEHKVELKMLTSTNDPAGGRFSTKLQAVPDLAGEVWAEISYSNGAKKETTPIALTTETAAGAHATQAPSGGVGGSVGTDESARSDKITGGRVEKTKLKAGQPNIRMTVNVPAFRLTLWQSGREVKSYPIGIGRQNFPLPIGERQATALIFNPRWVPAGGLAVRRSNEGRLDERIAPDDPRYSLGKVKIPLGDGYLIHETAKASDLGKLVSPGAIRMLTADIFDLAEKIVAARNLPLSPRQIEQAKTGTERLAVPLDPPLLFDINYDMQVVEGGVLHLYPDVYQRGTRAFERASLRAELEASGIDAAKLDDRLLEQMIERVSLTQEFVVRVADIEAGRALQAGRNRPLVE